MFKIYPHYCNGRNEPWTATADELRDFLMEELTYQNREALGALGDRPGLDALLSIGARHEDFVDFDVTRPGCLQSSVRIRIPRRA